MLRFETLGAPFERGEQQGRACEEVAHEWIDRVLKEIHDQLEASHVQARVDMPRRQMERAYPEGHEECCGIAAGMDMQERDYFSAAFSCRLLGKLASCTVLGFRAADGQPIMGKTDDIVLEELGGNVLETTVPHEGYRHAHFHFGGSIWTVAGMNECGFAMGMTGIPGPVIEEEGLFSLDALHTLLPKCATVPEAEAHLRDCHLNFYGFSLLVGDAEGRLALLEKNSTGMAILPAPPCELFVHTNHILEAELAAKSPAQEPSLHENGERRLRNAARQFQTIPCSEDGMWKLLVDHSPEGAICQYGEEGLYTDFMALFLPAQNKLSYRAGPPEYRDVGVLTVGPVLFGQGVPK